ncbi:hypothetical protein [Sinorhizobium fredii]|uniref:hypothetical protein n=1 Tax=Rhizobium fredii TaxID=380 RepID=UPI0004B07C5F|nr:hypothetical protein [Sinorhizobium fredii]AWI59017.1 hypothetical protein AB395_00003381 [Sinorhizobium fredii CCBAU 45436]
MSRKFEVTFQGTQGQVAQVKEQRDNVTVVKFVRRRQAKRFPGQFSGVLVKPTAH